VTRREELRAHRIAVRRVVASLSVDGDRTGARARVATVFGAILAALALSAVAIIAVLAPGHPDWRRTDTTIVDASTGARFVYVGGVLHPVRNSTSARLITGSATPVEVVAHRKLAAVRPGPVVGIAGVPDAVPAAADLVASSGLTATGGVPVPAGRAALVRSASTPSGFASLCLLTDSGMCYPIADAVSLASLGYASAPVIVLPADVAGRLPRGPVLSRSGALAPAPTETG
jgi:Type VII secretion system ESX-1, transport TM domain B